MYMKIYYFFIFKETLMTCEIVSNKILCEIQNTKLQLYGSP